MYKLFDFHPESGRLALSKSEPTGNYSIELRTLQGERLGEIPPELLPLEPHWSPDGSAVAFGTNDGLLYIHPIGEAAPKVVFSDPDLHAGFCAWAKDGTRLLFSAYNQTLRTPPDIYYLELDSSQVHQLTNEPKTVDRFPHWSPDGQYVAFRRQFLDEPELPRWLYLVNAQSGQSFPILNPDKGDLDIGRFSWSLDSAFLLITRLTLPHKEWGQLQVIRLEDHSPVWSYESETVRGGAFSPRGDQILGICTDELLWFSYPDGTLISRLSLHSAAPVRDYFTGHQVSFDRSGTTLFFLGEDGCLYRWKIGGDVDCLLEGQQPPRPVYSHQEYQVPSRDGRTIPVQRFIPPKPRHPAIFYVHGGPAEAINPNDPFMLRLLAEGVEVICVAYRGSLGYGLEHAEANRGEYGRADVSDVIDAAFDWQERTGSNRPLMIAGYSYGGFLTLLALAREENPLAAGITLYAASGIHRMGLHQQRAYPNEPEQQALARIERSPLEQAGNINVPLLIFHGALDTVATTQELKSIQATILAQRGSCELVVFEDDTHGLARHRDEIHQKVMEFLSQFE